MDGESNVAVLFDEDEFADDDRLIVEVKWLDNIIILLRMMNRYHLIFKIIRVQDHQRVFIVSPDEGEDLVWFDFWRLIFRRAKLVRDETNADGAWFNILQPTTLIKPYTSDDGRRSTPSYVEIKEDENGFTHLAYYEDIHSSEPTEWLTSGPWEVTKVVGVNPRTRSVYYISTSTGDESADSTQRHLYSVDLSGSISPLENYGDAVGQSNIPSFSWNDDSLKRNSEESRVTTRLMAKRQKLNRRPVTKVQSGSTEVGMYNAVFTPKCEFYVLEYLGPNIPYSRAIQVVNGLTL
jgi:hypothetical protein